MSDLDKSNSLLLDEIQKLHLELAAIRSNAVERTTELYKSEERFALAMRGANDGLWDWDLHTDEVFYSPRWKSILGYAENELEANIKTWARLVHPDDKDRVLEEFRDYKDGRSDAFEVEMRMRHKDGRKIYVLSRAFLVRRKSDNFPIRLVGTHVDITERKRAEEFEEKNAQILEMIGRGTPASEVYNSIALMYEQRNPGMRCSMVELHDDTLIHGGAPSLPEKYCDAVHGLKVGPEVGSCGASTFSGERILVEDIETDPKWNDLREFAVPHGMRCCWSEPIKDSNGNVLGAFGMYYDYPALPNESESKDLHSAARLAGIVMERDHDHKRIKQLAFIDELTGIASRAHFYQQLEDLIKTSQRHKQRFALLFVDLDDFKVVNDSLGHDAGDSLAKNDCR